MGSVFPFFTSFSSVFPSSISLPGSPAQGGLCPHGVTTDFPHSKSVTQWLDEMHPKFIWAELLQCLPKQTFTVP